MSLKIKMSIYNQYDDKNGCNCKKYTAQKGIVYCGVGGGGEPSKNQRVTD